MIDQRVQVIIPTAINLLTAINETMLMLHKINQPTEIILPSLRRRALLVINELGTLPIQTSITGNI